MKERTKELINKAISTIVVICMLPIGVAAIGVNANIVLNDSDYEITVDIEDVSSLSVDKIEKIKQDVLEYHLHGTSKGGIRVYGLTCTIFGHDKQISKAKVTEHKVAKTEPRCKEAIYTVTTCSRCEYEEMTFVNSYYIYCCPED